MFYSVRNDNVDIFVVGPNGKDLLRLTTATEVDSGGTWSPDGTQVAFESRQAFNGTPSDTAQVWLMTAEGKDAHPLTTDASTNRHPAWSPDGKQIAFESNRVDGVFQLYVINTDGSGERRLTGLADGAILPAWSKKNQIAFVRKINGANELWVVTPSGAAGSGRLVADAAYPAWSPDGNQIAFASTRAGKYQIYVSTSAGANLRRITSDAKQAISPAWSPDGKRIVYDGTASERSQLFIVSTNGGTPTRVLTDAFMDKRPDWR